MKCFFLFFSLQLLLIPAFAQVTVFSEDFGSHANCVTQNGTTWTTASTDTDDGAPGCASGSYWGVFNGEFRCNDVEGPGENAVNTFTTQAFDISCFTNVTVSFNARGTGALDCGGTGFDEIRGYYAINGGAWTQFASVCGGTGLPALLSVSGLSGNTVAMRITMGNKANDENYYIDNLLITGDPGVQFADAGPDQVICGGVTAQLQASGGISYAWNASPDLSCTGCSNPVASPVVTTDYIVTVTNNAGCTDDDTVRITVIPAPVVNLGNDTALCTGQQLQLDAGNPGAAYSWQDNSSQQTYNVTAGGIYHVTATIGGCSDTDSIMVATITAPVVSLGADQLICGMQPNVLLDATQPGSAYLWQDGSANASFTATLPGMYYVTVTNSCGSAADTVIIAAGTAPQVSLGSDRVLCTGDNELLDATQPGIATYSWQDNSAAPAFNVTGPGTYYVTVQNVCGTASDTIVFLAPEPLEPLLEIFEGACGQDTVWVNAAEDYPGASFLWEDATTADSNFFTASGTYSVEIASCGQVLTDTFQVILKKPGQEPVIPNVFTPNGDGMNDQYQLAGIEGSTSEFRCELYNRWGGLVASGDQDNFSWDGNINGQPAQEGTYFLSLSLRLQCSDKGLLQKHVAVTLFR